MSEIEIRPITPDEWEPFKAIRLRALEESPNAFGSTLKAERMLDVDIWRRWVADRPERRLWVALRGEEWVGTVTLALNVYEAEVFELFAMWVDPSARRCGVGRRMLEAAIEWAKTSETRRRIRLQVGEDNVAARALYESCGFVETGTRLPLREDLETEALTLERGLD